MDEPEKTLAERCARALGWKRPSEEGRCDVCGWRVVPHPEMGCWADNCSMRPCPEPRHDVLPPYGESSERGRSLAMELVERYRLSLVADADGYFCSDAELEREVKAHTACAAVAEWCAKFAEGKP